METNLKTKKMKMTKEAIVDEYVMAISTIESKDKDINGFKNRVTDLEKENKEIKKELSELKKSDYLDIKKERDSLLKEVDAYRKKDVDNVVKENQDLKKNINILAEDRQEILLTLGEMIDMLESNFKNISSSINNAYNGFDIIRRHAERKWMPQQIKPEEGNQ